MEIFYFKQQQALFFCYLYFTVRTASTLHVFSIIIMIIIGASGGHSGSRSIFSGKKYYYTCSLYIYLFIYFSGWRTDVETGGMVTHSHSLIYSILSSMFSPRSVHNKLDAWSNSYAAVHRC